MDHTRLDDAEAIRILWDSVVILARDAARLGDVAGQLTHTIRRFAETHVAGETDDPRQLLRALGAAAELCDAVNAARQGLEEAAAALGFAFVPNPSPHPLIAAQELAELRERVKGRMGARPKDT